MIFKNSPVTGFLGLLLIGLICFSGFGGTHLIMTASASRHYGIVGQSAPELDLSDWIDGRGKQIDLIIPMFLQ